MNAYFKYRVTGILKGHDQYLHTYNVKYFHFLKINIIFNIFKRYLGYEMQRVILLCYLIIDANSSFKKY